MRTEQEGVCKICLDVEEQGVYDEELSAYVRHPMRQSRAAFFMCTNTHPSDTLPSRHGRNAQVILEQAENRIWDACLSSDPSEPCQKSPGLDYTESPESNSLNAEVLWAILPDPQTSLILHLLYFLYLVKRIRLFFRNTNNKTKKSCYLCII